MPRFRASRSIHCCGFTLVELLVVIGIIAVLVSVLLPVLGQARAAGYKAQCLSNLRQMYVANVMYMNRYKNWHMPGWQGNSPQGLLQADGLDYWTALEEFRRNLGMQTYRNKGVGAPAWRGFLVKNRLCPEMVRGFQDLHPADAASGFVDLYVNYSYGMNVDGVDRNPDNINDPVYNPVKAPQCDGALGDKQLHGFKNTQVKRAAEKIFIADGMYWWTNCWGSGVHPGWRNRYSDYEIVRELTHRGNMADGRPYDTERTIAWRHKKKMANVLFFDGHAESLPKDRFTERDASGNLVPNLKLFSVLD